MDLTLKYLFLGLIALTCAALIHSITRMIMGKPANGYPAGALVLMFSVNPWWVAALGGIAGHLLSVYAWNSISAWIHRPIHLKQPNPED
jgi:hypothetical protein